MSRIPDSPTSKSETIRNMRLARQASHDVLRSRHPLRLPTPMTGSKSTTRIQPSRSRMSDSSGDDELTFIDTPTYHNNNTNHHHYGVPRFSISSTTSSIQTTLSTPRSSLPSVHEKEEAQQRNLWIDQRVSVDTLKLKGTLRFLGTTQFKSGVWAGIELDQPGTGKNDGSVDSIRYFTCPPKTGIFVLSNKVSCCRTQQQQRSNPTSPSSPKLRKKKTLAKQTSLPCITTTRQQPQQQPPPLPSSSSTSSSSQSPHHYHTSPPNQYHQKRSRHPLSVSPKTSGIPSPEITPTTPMQHEGLDPIIDSTTNSSTIPPSVMHHHPLQDEQGHPMDKFQSHQQQHHLISNNTMMLDSSNNHGKNERGEVVVGEGESFFSLSKKEIDLASSHPSSTSPPETNFPNSTKACFHCQEHEHVRTDLETKLAEMTAALNSNTDITLSYKHRVKELEQTVEELKRAGMETIELYEGATQKHESDMKRHTAKLAQAHARIQALENERDRLKLAKEDAETVLTEYTQVERTQLIQDHTEQQETNRHHIERLEQMLKEEKQFHHTCREENETLRTQKMDLEKDLDHEKQSHQTLRTEHEQLEKECTLLQESVQASHTEYQLLQDRVKALPPTPMGLASIPEQQLQIQLTETQRLLDEVRQEHSLATEHHRRHIITLNRDIAELESLIEAKIFKEADLLEALDHERKAVHRLLTEHQGSIAGQRRKMTATTSIRSIASSMTTTSTYSGSSAKMSTTPSSSSSSSTTTTTTSTAATPSPPRLPPPVAAVPPVPFTALHRTASLLEQHIDDETPYCEVCQVSGHDLMGCSSILDHIPPMPSSQFSSCRQPRRTVNKAF